jgi:Cu/Ag efflux protein CusF
MIRLAARVTPLLLAAGFLTACGSAEDTGKVVPPRSYEIRGVVRQISEPQAEQRQIWIHHEAIADFVDIRGNTVPMNSMTMPFHLAEAVDLSPIEPGDKVRFRLDVDWSAGVPARIVQLEVLSADTQLSFEADGAAESVEHGDSP